MMMTSGSVTARSSSLRRPMAATSTRPSSSIRSSVSPPNTGSERRIDATSVVQNRSGSASPASQDIHAERADGRVASHEASRTDLPDPA